MGGGIEIYNNNGVLQITDLFRNIQFVEKITGIVLSKAWPSTLTPAWGYQQIDLTPMANSLLALRCENGGWISWEERYKIKVPYSGGDFHFEQEQLWIYGTRNAQVTLYRFQFADIKPGNHFEIRNPAGELVFSDSTATFMKVFGIFQGNRPALWYTDGNNYNMGTLSYSSAAKTAVASGNIAWHENRSYNSSLLTVGRQFFRFNSIGSTESMYLLPKIYSDDSASYRMYNLHYNYLILDVTGL